MNITKYITIFILLVLMISVVDAQQITKGTLIKNSSVGNTSIYKQTNYYVNGKNIDDKTISPIIKIQGSMKSLKTKPNPVIKGTPYNKLNKSNKTILKQTMFFYNGVRV
jgi:hypothetical protein